MFEDIVCVKSYSVFIRLKKTAGIFNYVFKRANTLKREFETANPHFKIVEDFVLNSEINLFHIVNSRAYFLIKYSKNTFRMIEEGLGTYLHKMPRSRQIKRRLMGYPLLMGYDKQVVEILVQEPDKMQDEFLRSKTVTLDLKALQNQLSDFEKKGMMTCFVPEVDILYSDRKALILTQPIIEDGFKISKANVIEIYERMIKEAKASGLTVFLKMHPREHINYNHIFGNYDVKVLPKLMPIEVLNLDDRIKFDTAYTIFSGSIDNLIHVKNRKSLGVDYLKNYN